MSLRCFIFILIVTSNAVSFAQHSDLYKVSSIPIELRVKANAVVRYDHKTVEIPSLKRLNVVTKRIVTVFNENGISDINASVSYNDNLAIKTLEAIIFDENGEKVDRIKKSEFEDVSAVSNFSLYEDSRLKYLNYTPVAYPFTVELNIETTTVNTAYIPSWFPVDDYYVSTQSSKYQVKINPDLEIKINERNLDGYDIIKHVDSNGLSYEVTNLSSIKPEAYSPSFVDFVPSLQVALKQFHYEDFIGKTSDWESMGKWMYDNLLKERTNLSETTKASILKLVEGIDDPIEKAKVVYNFVQEQTRYISVQEGIGGIQPEFASKVDEVKYGDCKGLTNYTKALMDVVGVQSYYTRVNAARRTIDVDEDFVTFIGQTNHVILNIPSEQGNIWLECTSQTSPFNYTANFTDDRDVFVLTPEGGKIVHTKIYPTESNLQTTEAHYTLDADGDMSGTVEINAYGYQYALHEGIQNRPQREQILYYKDYWDYLNNLAIDNIQFQNDRDSIVFTEKTDVKIANFAKKTGNRLLFQPNAFNRYTEIPTRYKNRTLDFEIDRGYTDVDEFIINIDPSFEIEALPNAVEISNEFGSYKFSVEKISDTQLRYKRTQILNKGYYPKEAYDDFRTFMSTIVKHDKSKIVLITKS